MVQVATEMAAHWDRELLGGWEKGLRRQPGVHCVIRIWAYVSALRRI